MSLRQQNAARRLAATKAAEATIKPIVAAEVAAEVAAITEEIEAEEKIKIAKAIKDVKAKDNIAQKKAIVDSRIKDMAVMNRVLKYTKASQDKKIDKNISHLLKMQKELKSKGKITI